MFREEWIPQIRSGSYTNFRLYDLGSDSGQQRDISDQNPELLERLKKKLLAINASVMADGHDWNLE